MPPPISYRVQPKVRDETSEFRYTRRDGIFFFGIPELPHYPSGNFRESPGSVWNFRDVPGCSGKLRELPGNSPLIEGNRRELKGTDFFNEEEYDAKSRIEEIHECEESESGGEEDGQEGHLHQAGFSLPQVRDGCDGTGVESWGGGGGAGGGWSDGAWDADTGGGVVHFCLLS